MKRDIRETDLYKLILESYIWSFKSSKDANGRYNLENATANLRRLLLTPQVMSIMEQYTPEETREAIRAASMDCGNIEITKRYGIGTDE